MIPSSRSDSIVFGKFGKLAMRGLGMVALLWLVSAASDRLWIWLDRSVPSWDPADNLTNALHFLPTLAQADWFSGDWWTQFWARSSKYPPLLFALTVPFLQLFGLGEDQALLVNLLFSAVLLLSVYGIGRHLFDDRSGVWAAGLCILLPRLYTNRLQYFMDFPLAAMVALSFYCLTLWRDEKQRSRQWLWGLGFGASFGLAILTKQSALLFFLVPLVWLVVVCGRSGQRLVQLASGLLVTLAIALPWVRTNWIYQISAAFNSNVKSAIDEGDPPLSSIAAWTYYWQDLPRALSWPLLILPIASLMLYWLLPTRQKITTSERQGLIWLLGFWLGAFGLWSAIVNKDGRYILPALPIVAIVLAYGLTRWRPTVGRVAIALAGFLLLSNLFGIGGTAIAQRLSPQAELLPVLGATFPHAEVIDTIIRAQPQQIANLGMLASNPAVNQHTFNYYGNVRNFQVFSRQMGRDKGQTEEELRSLSWFLTQPDRRADAARRELTEAIDRSPDFRLNQTWTLPDNSRIQLYQRSRLPVMVQPAATTQTQLTLDRVTVPTRVPPDEPIPITYTWSGTWQQLTSGLVLLTWRQQNGSAFWLHDHGIGLGSLYAPAAPPDRSFQVTEQTAMQPPDTPGTYRLEAVYLNDKGQTEAIAVPPITITLDPAAPPVAAPELDWVTQLRSRAADLPKGIEALEEIFANIAQLNMFDPIQAYADQAARTLAVRQQQNPKNQEYAYGLAFAYALQQQVAPTIAALERVVQQDSQNPNAYAYLAAAHLYALHPHAAQAAIDSALAIAPDQPELHAIASAAAFMRGNVWQAWQQWQEGQIGG